MTREQAVISSDIEGGRFEAASSDVIFENITVSDVDFSHSSLWRLTSEGSTFVRCNFESLKVEHGPLGLPPGSVFRECSFDRADLRGIEPGHARFEKCTFRETKIEGWTALCSEFVACTFATTIESCKFSGTRHGCSDWRIWKRRNEFRRNDFRGCEFRNTSFVGRIDLGDQLLPQSNEYVFLDRLRERFTRAKEDVLRWRDEEARRHALVMLDVYYFDADSREQLFVRRDDLPIRADVRERTWELLERPM